MVRMINQWLGKLQWHRDERGIALVESLVAVAILGTAVVTLIISMATGSIAIRETDEEVVVQSLARTQLEYIKGYAYDPDATTYPTVSTPPGYTISVGVSSTPDADPDIQKVTANISREGTPILTIEDYKVNR
ncbi:hypothetical protein ACFLXF_02670 [Chloroflexota bacterium]